MNSIGYNLGDYHDKLDEAFPSSQMSEGARGVVVYAFTEYVREQRLSLDAAIAVLGDPEQVNRFITIGRNAGGLKAMSPADPEDGTSRITVTPKLQRDMDFVKDSARDFVGIGEKTNKILLVIERIVRETNTASADSGKVLADIHAAAEELKRNTRHAIDATRDIVQRLDSIPARLDAQLQRMEGLEKGIDRATEEAQKATGAAAIAAERVEPEKTHKENIKIMVHSVAWGTIASTLCGAGFGALVAYFSGQNASCRNTETRIIERSSPPPESFILRDGSGRKLGTLKAVPQQPIKKSAPQNGRRPDFARL